jgi:hypothetical protein
VNLQGERTSQTDPLERLASVIQASRAIRSEVALTICESSEMRLASRQLRMDSLRTTAGTAAVRRILQVRKPQRIRTVADAIAEMLSRQGYAAFVAGDPQDTASIQ